MEENKNKVVLGIQRMEAPQFTVAQNLPCSTFQHRFLGRENSSAVDQKIRKTLLLQPK
ncbi:hypothetical protein GYH30_011421 [Glycine max]|nr:hypothetical protein GYH30_011421 [Glycine max]